MTKRAHEVWFDSVLQTVNPQLLTPQRQLQVAPWSESVNMISVTGWGGRCVQERFQRTDSGGSLQQDHLAQSHAGQLLLLVYSCALVNWML